MSYDDLRYHKIVDCHFRTLIMSLSVVLVTCNIPLFYVSPAPAMSSVCLTLTSIYQRVCLTPTLRALRTYVRTFVRTYIRTQMSQVSQIWGLGHGCGSMAGESHHGSIYAHSRFWGQEKLYYYITVHELVLHGTGD